MPRLPHADLRRRFQHKTVLKARHMLLQKFHDFRKLLPALDIGCRQVIRIGTVHSGHVCHVQRDHAGENGRVNEHMPGRRRDACSRQLLNVPLRHLIAFFERIHIFHALHVHASHLHHQGHGLHGAVAFSSLKIRRARSGRDIPVPSAVNGHLRADQAPSALVFHENSGKPVFFHMRFTRHRV